MTIYQQFNLTTPRTKPALEILVGGLLETIYYFQFSVILSSKRKLIEINHFNKIKFNDN